MSSKVLVFVEKDPCIAERKVSCQNKVDICLFVLISSNYLITSAGFGPEQTVCKYTPRHGGINLWNLNPDVT